MRRRTQISELKAKLSAYLQVVRKGGELIVMDRKTPVARIVPYDEPAPALRIRMPKPGAPLPCDVPLPPPLPEIPDLDRILREERTPDR